MMLSSNQGLHNQRTGLESLGSVDLEAYQTLANTDLTNMLNGEIPETDITDIKLLSSTLQEFGSRSLESPNFLLNSLASYNPGTLLTSDKPSIKPDPVSHLPSCNCFVHQAATRNNRSAAVTTNQAAVISTNNSATAIPALNGGSRWASNTITYSFFTGGGYYGQETGVRTFSATAQNYARRILADIQSLINVNFVEVADNANSYGQIRFQLSNGPGYAYTYYPSNSPLGGDVHFNPNYDNANDINGLQSGIGSHGYMALVHEIGHALGLKHPGDYNGNGSGDPPFLPFAEDNTGNTIMSYNFTGNSAATFMPYDILALQNLYGARATNAGNTTYNFATLSNYSDGATIWGSGSPSKLTLWDSGGVDLLNFGSLASNSGGYRFDLADGGWLSTRTGFNTLRYNALGDAANGTYLTTATGTRLAYGANIEYLIGTSSNDEILGNTLGNILWGSSGNDAIYGGIGNDILLGGPESDFIMGGDGVDEFILGGSGQPFFSHGIDTIYDWTAGEKISLSKSTFTALGSGIGNGFSIGSEFAWAYGAADTSSAVIVYDRNTGGLFYNANGAAPGFASAGQFAVITGNPNLYATDFSIIA